MKKIIIFVILMFFLTIPAVFADVPSQEFSDVPNNHWAFSQINTMHSMNIIIGDDNNLFLPNKSVTKAEFLKMLIELGNNTNVFKPINYIKKPTFPYKDVSQDAWFYKYVVDAYNRGIIDNGIEFHPNDPLSREEMAFMEAKFYVNLFPDKAQLLSKFATDFIDFDDYEKIDVKYNTSVLFLESQDLLHGKFIKNGSLIYDPSGNLTKAEASTITYNLFQTIKTNNIENKILYQKNDLKFTSLNQKNGQTIIEASISEKPTTGYSVHINKAEINNGTINIYYSIKEPLYQQYVGLIQTYPKDLYILNINNDINYKYNFIINI